jgi:SAM-dependent MidA family methyltransferase
MAADCRALILDRIRQRGPLTAAEYMALALYAPGAGYYARAARRSGRTGDFVTSVDAGPWFGRLLAVQFATWLREMDGLGGPAPRDLVEAGAGNGRLSRDVLDALASSQPDLYERLTVRLVERSEAARAEHGAVLSGHAARLGSSADTLPSNVNGIIFANELLDAFPVHVVIGTPEGLREVYVDARPDDRLIERQGPPSTPALAEYLDEVGIALGPAQRAEINLEALAWVREAARCLARGYLVIIDYGHEAAALYSTERPGGTLTSFSRHMADAPATDEPGTPAWLAAPGDRDLTAHIDLTSIRRAAEAAGLHTVLVTDQTRFLLDIAGRSDVLAVLSSEASQHDRLLLKTLLVPGGLGTTHKVMVFRG